MDKIDVLKETFLKVLDKNMKRVLTQDVLICTKCEETFENITEALRHKDSKGGNPKDYGD